jgi:hypothetical protein
MARGVSHDGITHSFSRLKFSDVDPHATYIFCVQGGEQRTRTDAWEKALAERPAQCVVILDQQAQSLRASVESVVRECSLMDAKGLLEFCSSETVYVDITGLTHSVWASFIRVFLAATAVRQVFAVYSEPDEYQPHPSPSSSSRFDLTSTFGGLAPLPGFAILSEPVRGETNVLVLFLGFESARPEHLASTFDPVPKVVAIVGVPGFRMEYPQITIDSNSVFLNEHRVFHNLRFAKASCPFQAYSALADIRRDYPGSYFFIAPIGTKPHALGAIWYAIDHPEDTEIIYDHPVRKADRTAGIGQTHVYRLKPFDVNR